MELTYTTTAQAEWDETDAGGGYSSISLGCYTAEVMGWRGGWRWGAWIIRGRGPVRLKRDWCEDRDAAKAAAEAAIRHHAEKQEK